MIRTLKGPGAPPAAVCTTGEEYLTDQMRLQAELQSFSNLWRGGFFTADPSDPLAPYWLDGMLGHHHVIYLTCMRPWVGPETSALEIGCGRGAWSRMLLGAKHVVCVDALSAEHNAFWGYVGEPDNVEYHQVRDFSLSMIPDASIDYVFSYDALCHVSFEGITEYARSLHRVMRQGAHGFLMVADYVKYNTYVDSLGQHNALLVPFGRRRRMLRAAGAWLVARYAHWDARRHDIRPMDLHENNEPAPGRWFHAGTSETCGLLRSTGFAVLDEDMRVDPRSPIIHFQK
jgi:SAM-dependent methyltransferase